MAVYTALNQQDIENFLTHYDLGALESFEGIEAGVSNTNYLLKIGGIPYILTLFEKHYKLEELPYFTAIMQWWHARGIHCPQPLKMRDGRVLSALKEKPAILVAFLEGGGVEHITVEHMLQLGRLAAEMHIAGMEFPYSRANALSVSTWEELVDAIGSRADEIEPGLADLVRGECNYLYEHWPQNLPSGPIHADLFPDNVFFIKTFGKKPVLSGVIDFYFTCNDAWAYDLAICVNAWCFDGRNRFVAERAQALMDAYNEVRPLTYEEEAAFPLLLRGSALRFLLTRAQAWLEHPKEALMTPKDPLEYAHKLRFHQSVKNANYHP